MNKLPFVWETYQYLYFEKDFNWKVSVWTITITFSVIAFLIGNYTMAILILISMCALIIHALKAPKIRRFEINSTGVVIDQEKWSFSNMHSFWIEDNRKFHLPSHILFSMNKFTDSLLCIPLPIETNSNDIHNIHSELVKILPEEYLKESFIQKIMEYWGF